jgi:hypothetical protein
VLPTFSTSTLFYQVKLTVLEALPLCPYQSQPFVGHQTQTSIEELSSEGTEGSLEIETTQMRQSTTQEETLQTSMEVGETTSETKLKVKTTHQKYILDHFYPHPVFRKHP